MQTRSPLACLAVACGAWACQAPTPPGTPAQPPNPGTTQAATDGDPQPAPPAAGTLERLLYDKAQKYASGMLGTDLRFEEELKEGELRDYLAVLRYGRCYRVVGAGDSGVADLDLRLFDPNGVLAQEDLGQDALPVLGVQSEICPGDSGAFRLQVRMRAGQGRFIVRVYESAG